jgi:hypothetical protein
MEKDYLWDKTGSDPEIEKLENALRAFRYRETATPALPGKVLQFRKEPVREIFPFAKFAAAACIAFIVITLGIWQEISSNKIEGEKDLAKTVEPQIDAAVPNVINVGKSDNSLIKDDLIVKKLGNSKQLSEPKISRIHKAVPVNVRQSQTKIENFKHPKPNVALTKEEHYAYNQLMLALSITSSKLKLVKDKVEGIEKQIVVSENGR